MQKLNSFKIIAGKYKGKLLYMPTLDSTRSSKSILRESFFNKLQFDIIDMPLVEIFAGSGSIGLEALSRGASEVYFIEKNIDAFRVLEKNIHILGVETDSKAYLGDSFEVIKEIERSLKSKKQKAFFYADPPFAIRNTHDKIYIKTFEMLSLIPREIVEMIAIEYMSGLELPDKIGEFSLNKTKKFGKSSLAYYL